MAKKRQSGHPATDRSVSAVAAPRRGARRSALVWSGLGFAAGSLFWNVVSPEADFARIFGLTTSAPEYTASIPLLEKLPHRLPAMSLNGVGDGAEANCIELILDRVTRETRPANCTADSALLELAESSARQDRLVPPVSDLPNAQAGRVDRGFASEGAR